MQTIIKNERVMRREASLEYTDNEIVENPNIFNIWTRTYQRRDKNFCE